MLTLRTRCGVKKHGGPPYTPFLHNPHFLVLTLLLQHPTLSSQPPSHCTASPNLDALRASLFSHAHNDLKHLPHHCLHNIAHPFVLRHMLTVYLVVSTFDTPLRHFANNASTCPHPPTLADSTSPCLTNNRNHLLLPLASAVDALPLPRSSPLEPYPTAQSRRPLPLVLFPRAFRVRHIIEASLCLPRAFLGAAQLSQARLRPLQNNAEPACLHRLARALQNSGTALETSQPS